MKRFLWLLLIIVLTACTTSTSTVVATETVPLAPSATAQLPEPGVTVIHAPDAKIAMETYVSSWQAGDYQTMYQQLTPLTRDAIPFEKFQQVHNDAARAMTMQSFTVEILSVLTNPTSAQVTYRITYETALFGPLVRQTLANFSLVEGAWRLQWEEGLVLPELSGGNRLVLDVKAPTRGNIYDRNGQALVVQTDAYALGLIPGQINRDREGTLVARLSELTGRTQQSIRDSYKDAGPDWYIPVGDAPADAVDKEYNLLSSLSGLVMRKYTTRYYWDMGAAAHVTGYVQLIPAEELQEYQRQGYVGDEWVGRAGLEQWGEDVLSGQRAASLYVVDPQGQYVARLAQTPSQPAKNIYTTLDKDLQVEAQRAIASFDGAIVVMEVDSGRILAMASSPRFNPNLFDPNNYNSSWQLSAMLDPNRNRLLNRATQGTYPLGSIYKIITMSAAMETGAFSADSVYDCGYAFTDLPGVTLYDWTYEKKIDASGKLTLPEGLMRSCNPWFYHIGVELFRLNATTALADMGRGFGLGSPTGLVGLPESAGNIAAPTTDFEAAQLAIGQSTLLVTPLQVVDFIAAIANGGTLYRPQVIEKITTPDGVEVSSFKPEVRGQLPISENTLQVVRSAMRSVVANRRGTAYYALVGAPVPIYGKTGTAQDPPDLPHAWFAGYTAAGRKDRPDIAVVVIAENAGEGSEIAAPIFRRIVEVYFIGRPSTLYPWESEYNVTRTPKPSETPAP